MPPGGRSYKLLSNKMSEKIKTWIVARLIRKQIGRGKKWIVALLMRKQISRGENIK